MSSDFYRALEAEIAGLEASLNADPRFKKLNQLRRVRELYEHDPAPGVRPDAKTAPEDFRPFHQDLKLQMPDRLPPQNKGGRRVSPERLKAMAYARELLGSRTIPTRTADILDYLEDHGVKIGGVDPLSNLSAMLSNTSGFKSHGRSGWTLDPLPENAEAADDVPEEGAPAAPNRIPTDHREPANQAQGREAVPGGGT